MPPPAPKCPAVEKPTRVLWDVPIYQQQTNFTCGASAMQAVLAYYGMEYGEDVLAKEMGSDPKNGTDHDRMVEFAKAKGLKAFVKSPVTFAEIVDSIEKGQPVIIELQAWLEPHVPKKWAEIWDAGHYMTVIGLDKDNLYFVDPSFQGRRGFIPCEEFVTRWHDLDWKNNKLWYAAIFFEGKPNPLPVFGKVD